MKGTRKIRTAAGLALLALCLQCFTAFAAPTYDNLPEGMTREQLDRLNDNVIEWDEISDLVIWWNPTYVRYLESAQSNMAEMKAGYSDFVDEARDQLEEIDGIMDTIRSSQETIASLPGSTVTMNGMTMPKSAALAALQGSMDQTKEGRRQLKNTLHTTKTSLSRADKTIEISLRPLREQMISVVQGLVISYKQLEVNRTMAAQQAALYETLYGMQQRLLAQNMATGLEVQAYAARLEGARQSLAQIDAGLLQLRRNIALQCGYGPDAEVVIADIPAPDPNYAAGRNYEEDRARAVSGNAEVISAGKVTDFSGYGFQLRDMAENEAVGRASAAMDGLYSDLQKKKALYDAAETSRQRAELAKNGAERQYSLGLLGKGEYDGLVLQYISYEAAAGLAELNYTQVITSYQWALRGILDISGGAS